MNANTVYALEVIVFNASVGNRQFYLYQLTQEQFNVLDELLHCQIDLAKIQDKVDPGCFDAHTYTLGISFVAHDPEFPNWTPSRWVSGHTLEYIDFPTVLKHYSRVLKQAACIKCNILAM